ALAKDPAHRWQTAEDFAEALQAAGTQLEHGAPHDPAAFVPGPASPPPVGPPPPGEQRDRRWPWFAIGLLSVALAAFLIYLAVAGLTGGEAQTVPKVVGEQLVQARPILAQLRLEVAGAH